MISDGQPWELSVLHNLQHSYEARGFKFHISPPPELIPSFLAGHRPDAIAVSPDGGGIIIEVKRHRAEASNRQLADLAKKVAGQKRWEFQVIYTNPTTEESDDIAKATVKQINAGLQEIQLLADSGHYAPALIFGWAVLESLARFARGLGSSRGHSPVQVVQALAEEGYLANDDAQRLREMARVRSSLVHGDLSVTVSAEQVGFLLGQLRALKSEITKLAA
jgi:hypothetical protein